MRIEHFENRAEWLEARKQGIGGSDAPCVLGSSPYRTPLQVWASKVGLDGGEDSGETYSMRRGSHMEPFLAEYLVREVEASRADGSLVATCTNLGGLAIVRGDEPWQAYSPDGFLHVGIRGDAPEEFEECLVEFKSHARGASEWDEGPPPHVIDQVQYGMVVCDLPACYVAVDLGTEFRWARVERNPGWWKANAPALREFWRLVETETPPCPTGDEADRKVLTALWPREQAGKTVPLDGDALDLAWQYDEAAKEKKAAEEQMDAIANEMRVLLTDAERGVLPDGSGWTCKAQSRPKMVADPSGARTESRVLRRVARKDM